MSRALLLLLLAAASAHAAAPASVEVGRFGRVQVLAPKGRPAHAVVLLADPGQGEALGTALASGDTLVLLADAAHYVASFPQKAGGRCAYPAGDVEVLSQALQKQRELPEYLHPLLVGAGEEGAPLAYAALAQAPPGTFPGALSLGFHPRLALARGLCPGEGLVRTRTADGAEELLRPARRMTGAWRVLPLDAVHAPLHDFVLATPGARLLAPVPRASAQQAAAQEALAALQRDTAEAPAATGTPTTAAAQSTAAPSPTAAPSTAAAPLPSVDGLPLVLAPVAHPVSDALVLMVSGDGGWAGLDRELASAFNAQGMPVLGWDSLKYFWHKRTPEEAAQDMARALGHYGALWGARRVLLVGYSRGADVLPAITARLAPGVRAQVALLALLGPGQEAEFEVHVLDLVGARGRDLHPLLPELARLGPLPLLCVYGEDERGESLCPLLQGREGARVTELPGGHHFEGDYAAVAREVLGAAKAGPHGL